MSKTYRVPTIAEARECLQRLINSHFNNDGEHARASIPADPNRDDDLLLSSLLRHLEELSKSAEPRVCFDILTLARDEKDLARAGQWMAVYRLMIALGLVDLKSVTGDTAVPDGVSLIARERARQIDMEGFTISHDRDYKDPDLGLAAICYLASACVQLTDWNKSPGSGRREGLLTRLSNDFAELWPWPLDWFKATKNEPCRNLVIAGALIAAQLDARSDRERIQGIHGARNVFNVLSAWLGTPEAQDIAKHPKFQEFADSFGYAVGRGFPQTLPSEVSGHE